MRRPPTALLAASLLLPLLLVAGPVGPAVSQDDARTIAASSTPVAKGRLDNVLKRVNAARTHARTCGDRRYPAVGAVKRNARLDRAAGGFARLMARKEFFSHVSPNGDDPGDRITDAGYRWSRYGEVIAARQRTAAAVVRDWLASPGHCATIMSRYRHIGVGYAFDRDSPHQRYWVLDFASR